VNEVFLITAAALAGIALGIAVATAKKLSRWIQTQQKINKATVETFKAHDEATRSVSRRIDQIVFRRGR
jgi:hypothetical protein